MSAVDDQVTAESPVPAAHAEPFPPDDVYRAPQAAVQDPIPRSSLRGWMLIAAVAALALVGGFVVYELWFSGLLESRRQSALLTEFKHSLVLDDTPRLVTPPEGAPVGVIQIPRLGMEQVIVQGISSDDTKSGPGHDPSTVAPGQAGNAVILARRITYGAPFHNLDQLRSGDSVFVTTRQGQFLYTVERSSTTSLGDPAPVAVTTDDRITLITSDPLRRSQRELVVVAKLQGKGLQVPGPLPLRPSGQRPGESTGLAGRWGWMLLWGQLLLAAVAITAYLYRRGQNRAVIYLLTTPILIVLAVLFYGAADSLLPPML